MNIFASKFNRRRLLLKERGGNMLLKGRPGMKCAKLFPGFVCFEVL